MAIIATGCHSHLHSDLPPADMMMHPGPGVDGPGPGVMMYQPPTPQVGAVSQLQFSGPEGMTVQWDVTAPGRFDSEPLVAPARYNFPQGLMYRLKLANIPGRPGIELYPSIELAFAVPRSEAFLAHNAIPIQFTEEDFDQILQGNFVTKVIYLPNPEFQELALAGVETLVSTRLEPGVDPIVEADRRGAILAIVRVGNKDMQLPATAAENGVRAMAYQAPMCGPGPYGGVMPGPYVAGVTAPQYGMPMCGTPIGLPGPPHVPLGVPAGLQRHVMVNHTCVSLPEPTHEIRIDEKQCPGMSYPQPANHICVLERSCAGPEPKACCQGGGCAPGGMACPVGAPGYPMGPVSGGVAPAGLQQPAQPGCGN
jgi:hypothetical protein